MHPLEIADVRLLTLDGTPCTGGELAGCVTVVVVLRHLA